MAKRDVAAEIRAIAQRADPRAGRRLGDDDPGRRARAARTTAASASRDHPSDVAGDPDLLNLTRPELVRSIHERYLAAGADITTTNTFTATSIGQADYGLEDAVYEMNLAGARIAREARRRPLRRRLGRAAERHALAQPEGRRPVVPHAHLRRGQGRLRRADARARRGRRRPAPARDDLRHAEREGGDRRGARGRARAAALDLGHDRRPVGPHAERARRSRRSGPRSSTPSR